MLFVIAGLSVIGFASAAFWIARNITRPLADLTQSVDKIRLGTYDVPPSPPRRDELGVLAEGLQLMRAAVMSRDQSIRRLAYEDTLTGLMNRTAFSARLGQALIEGRGTAIGVAMINLHRFRRINEHLGYSVGDAVLTKTAARLAAVPSVNTAVARLAADEFAAFARLRDGTDLRAWGESLLVALSEPVLVETQPIDISATIGLALSLDAASAPDDLLRCADLALEQARREKRSVAIYDDAREVSACGAPSNRTNCDSSTSPRSNWRQAGWRARKCSCDGNIRPGDCSVRPRSSRLPSKPDSYGESPAGPWIGPWPRAPRGTGRALRCSSPSISAPTISPTLSSPGGSRVC
jgi:diguanylate cyclase (GGDEF)-like protein